MFEDLVGQDNVKKKLTFYSKSFAATQTCPFLNFVGAAGLGKTQFCREFAKSLKNEDGDYRKFIEVNCSSIKNNAAFFEVLYPEIKKEECVVFFDEAHKLPDDLVNVFLTILNIEKNFIRSFIWEGDEYFFDFRKIVFLFATTETDKLFPPLKDRFRPVDFDSYKREDISAIIQSNCSGIKFTKSVAEKIADIARGNARNAVMTAQDISSFCKFKKKKTFDEKLFENYKDSLGILPHGITNSERQILSVLKENGPSTLHFVSAKTGLSPNSIRLDHERYLLRKNLIQIDGKRKLTNEGRSLINEIEH